MAGNLERYAAETSAYPANKQKQDSQLSGSINLPAQTNTPPPKIPRLPPP